MKSEQAVTDSLGIVIEVKYAEDDNRESAAQAAQGDE